MLKKKFGSYEVRAWEEYRRTKTGSAVEVVSPQKYDNAASPVNEKAIKKVATPSNKTSTTKKPPPGPGWKHKLVSENEKNRCCWLSPTRNIEFKRWAPACEFEKLREEFGNEVRAWGEYRRRKAGSRTCLVVSPRQYDDDDYPIAGRTIKTAVNTSNQTGTQRSHSPPGPGWKDKILAEGQTNCRHWISPTRNIEFRRRSHACEFEELRLKLGNEVQAWEEYRKTKVGFDTCVVSASQYDMVGVGEKSKTENVATPNKARATKPRRAKKRMFER